MAEAKKETVKGEEIKKEKTVKIKIPREKKEDGDVFVSINERTWLIKRGVEVEVPECVKKIIELSEKMQEEAYDFDSSVQN